MVNKQYLKYKEHYREYYQKNKEKIKDRERFRKEENREKINQKAREYRKKNKEIINLKQKERYKKNRDKYLDYQRELIMILNYPIEVEKKKMKVRDLIELWNSDKKNYKEILENEVEKVLNEFEDEFFYKISLQKRGLELVIYSKKPIKGEWPEQLIRIGSENYKGNMVSNAEGKGELAGAYILKSDTKTVYVTLGASHRAIEVENE